MEVRAQHHRWVLLSVPTPLLLPSTCLVKPQWELRGHSQRTPSPTRDGEIHSREGHSQQTQSPTRDGEIHSRKGHSQQTPSPTRYTRKRGTRSRHPRRLEMERYTRERGTRSRHNRRLEMERYTRERGTRSRHPRRRDTLERGALAADILADWREIHSREGHSQRTPSPNRDGEIHLTQSVTGAGS